MDMLPVETADVVIIGGGVMGTSTAYHLAARGIKNIVLLEREEFFGHGATSRCAGGARHQFGTEVSVWLSIESLGMLERFKEELGQDIEFRKCGYLFDLTNDLDVEQFRSNVELQHRLGVTTRWLSADDVRASLPAMAFAGAKAGTLTDEDRLIDPNVVVAGYVNAARRLGATLLNDVEVIAIRGASGRLRAVETSRGPIDTALVVNAAGPWAAPVSALAGPSLPVEPIRRQWFTTTPLPGLTDDLPFVIDFAQSLYCQREGQGLLGGMGNPDEEAGFEQNVDEEFELTNLAATAAGMPMLESAGRASHWTGLYEVMPDAHPIFGATPIDGFPVVTGFSGHGFMHGPIAGKLMSELIVDGSYGAADFSALDLARVPEHRLIQEYNVV
jgi:sarcosine oxidase subunit beta